MFIIARGVGVGGLIYTYFDTHRNAFQTLSTTSKNNKTSHVLAVRTACEHQPLCLCSLHGTFSPISRCDYRRNVLGKS